MAEYQTPVDIANRALQHCGSPRIDSTLGFAENSKAAAEIAFCYGKLRRAELRKNSWTFAVKYAALRAIDTNTMLLVSGLWVSGTTYFVGSIAADQSGNLWISKVPNNLGNDPQSSTTWEPYFGPMTISLFSAGNSYSASELVYTAAGNGTSLVYLSLQNGNTDTPATATAYDATATYFKNQVVTYLSIAYMSLIDLNINNTPSSAPALFNIATTYAAGSSVGGSDGMIYTSIGSGNVGHDPVLTTGYWTNTGVLNPWTTSFVGGTGSDKWLLIGGTAFPNGVGLTTLNIIYPIGTGPVSQSTSLNVFRLPSGYLRPAAQSPKSRPISYLGGPSGIAYNDWRFDGSYIVTSDVGPIVFRFIADVTDVSRFDDMFCEALAARVGLEVCEPITQSNTQLGTIAKIYEEWMGRAAVANAIEQGWEDPPMDDFIACRA